MHRSSCKIITLYETHTVQSIAREDKLSVQISSKYNAHNQVYTISVTWESKLSCQRSIKIRNIVRIHYSYVNIYIESLQYEYSCLLENLLTSFFEVIYCCGKSYIPWQRIPYLGTMYFIRNLRTWSLPNGTRRSSACRVSHWWTSLFLT